MNKFAYGDDERLLGPYWSQPGRSIVENKLRDIEPSTSEWESVERIEYEPGTKGQRTGEGTMFMHRRLQLIECMDYIRTWSSFSAWYDKFQRNKRDSGGQGDVIDEMFDAMILAEPTWRNDDSWREKEVEIEWGSGLLLARRK